MSRGTIVVGGAIAGKPRAGGHTCVFLQYLLGFRRLGWDVLFVNSVEPMWWSTLTTLSRRCATSGSAIRSACCAAGPTARWASRGELCSRPSARRRCS
jgi:hypothetical protein